MPFSFFKKKEKKSDRSATLDGSHDKPARGDSGPFEYKVTFLGDTGSGKSEVILRLLGREFYHSIQPTIGFVSFAILHTMLFYFLLNRAAFFSLKHTTRSGENKLLIWDTAGQDRFVCFSFSSHLCFIHFCCVLL